MKYLTPLSAALASTGLLVACGGSPSSSAPSDGGGPSGITLSGVVAKGAALAGASVTAKCASGTATPVTAGSDGSYTLTIAGGALPCVLSATGVGADAALVLHSVATGTTTSATANITPLTELLVAQLVGQEPAAYMVAVSANTLASSVTSSAVSTAQAAVVSTLVAAGVSTSAITNLVTQPLVAATGGTAGNAYDGVLDALSTQLGTAGTTLAQLTTTVANTAASASGTPTTQADTSALPADLLLKPKASSCDALRSTPYRLIKMAASLTPGAAEPVTSTEIMTIDASALTASFTDGSSVPLTAVAGASCRFTFDDGELAVAPSGVIVVRALIGDDDDTVSTTDRGHYHLMIALPQQTLALADLAGTWNMLGQNRDDDNLAVPYSGTAVVNASGAMTSVKCFDDAIAAPEASCTTDTTLLPVFSAHASGGFELTSTDPGEVWTDRAFAYRAGNGAMMLVTINAQGEVGLGTKQRTLTVPTVGDVNTNWNFTADTSLFAATALSANTHTVATASGSGFTRQTATRGTTVTHTQTLEINSPRNGYSHRLAAGVTDSNGASVSVREFYALGLQGMGITTLTMPNTNASGASNARFVLSVRE